VKNLANICVTQTPIRVLLLLNGDFTALPFYLGVILIDYCFIERVYIFI